MEYGGLARTTSKVRSRPWLSRKAGAVRVSPWAMCAVDDAVQEQVHPGDRRGSVVELLAVEAQVAPFLALAAQLGGGGDQHAAGAAGGVVDRLARLGLEHQRHQVDERAVGVELLGGVAGVVGELLDQVLVAVAEFVLGQVRDRQDLAGEVLDQVLERRVREQVLVAPVAVAEHAGERVGVGRLDGPHRLQDRGADVGGDLADVRPVRAVRDREAVVFRQVGERLVAVDRRGLRRAPRRTRRRSA